MDNHLTLNITDDVIIIDVVLAKKVSRKQNAMIPMGHILSSTFLLTPRIAFKFCHPLLVYTIHSMLFKKNNNQED